MKGKDDQVKPLGLGCAVNVCMCVGARVFIEGIELWGCGGGVYMGCVYMGGVCMCMCLFGHM